MKGATMKCPFCETVMDRKDDYVHSSDRGGTFIPSALYICEECDIEYRWTKGRHPSIADYLVWEDPSC